MDASSICPALPARCTSPTGPSGKSPCSGRRGICAESAECTSTPSSPAYQTCVGQTETVPEDCQCGNRRSGSSVIDVYFFNKTANTLTYVGPGTPSEAPNWTNLGGSGKECRIGFWQIPLPSSVPPGGAFLARGWSGEHSSRGDCFHTSWYHICFTYGINGSSTNAVTIFLQRRRPPKDHRQDCRNFENVTNSSQAQGNLTLQATALNHPGYQFVVTGGNGGPTGCTVTPDSCPTGQFCNPSTLTCTGGCKLTPDSCPMGMTCDPNTRSCIVEKACTSNTGCNLDFICTAGKCVAGCVVGENRCSAGKTCVKGQCQPTTTPDGDRTRLILIITVSILVFLIFIAGIVYFIYATNK